MFTTTTTIAPAELKIRFAKPLLIALAVPFLALVLTACGNNNNGSGGGANPPQTMEPMPSGGGSGTNPPPPAVSMPIGGATNTLYTQGVWETATPDAVGFSETRLDAVVASAVSDGTYSQAFLVIKDGMLIRESYKGIGPTEITNYQDAVGAQAVPSRFQARTASDLATSWAGAQSVMSLLIGIAVDKGEISSLDEKVSTHISAWSGQTGLADVTVRQLLNMRGGLVPACVDPTTKQRIPCTIFDPRSFGGTRITSADDQLNVCVQDRMLAEIGVIHSWSPPRVTGSVTGATQIAWREGDWVYSNCDPMVLGAVLTEASGMSVQEYADRNLFSKLGITAHWWTDNMPDGAEHYLGYCCIDATPRDFAKIGQLILNRGVWGTEQVVSTAYVDLIRGILSNDFAIPFVGERVHHYGYGFWNIPTETLLNFPQADEDMWVRAVGLDTQEIAIDLVNLMVVVRNSLYYRLDPDNNREAKFAPTDPAELSIPFTMPGIATFANPTRSSLDFTRTAYMVKLALVAENCPADGSGIEYSMRFENNWNSVTFPTNFPPRGDHFTSLVGGVHSSVHTFWATGQQASRGIESMAETGGTSLLLAEVNAAAQARGYVGTVAGVTSFRVNANCPLVTFTSMLAPSHDWFTGVSGLDLRDDTGQFVDTMTVDLRIYDAGTETGEDFSLSGLTTTPQADITRLTTDAQDTDFADGVHRTTGAFAARMIFTKIN